jgi:manganese oxidase
MQLSKKLLIALALAGSTLMAASGSAAVRQYFIAAEDQVWDFAPTNQNLIHCHPEAAPCPIPAPWTDSHTFPVTRYVQYTDAHFTASVAQPVWLGILGPILRAEVGDVVQVHFCNHATSGAYGMHPHGFRYDKDNEGAHYFGVNAKQPPGAGAEVPPGACFDYSWSADSDSGPGLGESSSKVWWYHSHIFETTEPSRGLLGPIIITRKGAARSATDPSPKDIDQEFVASFFIHDMLGGAEEGLMHSINGYIFGNLKGLVMSEGQNVRWYLLGMGNEVDQHSAHWHGKTVTIGARRTARRTDVVELLPASMVTADMKADNPGEWMFHCHVVDHIAGGMLTSYQILPAGGGKGK